MNSHIKDSGNNYTLYIDQGTDYELIVPLDSFIIDKPTPNILASSSFNVLLINQTDTILTNSIGTLNVDDYSFEGTIARHKSSVNKFEIEIEKITESDSIKLIFSSDMTSRLIHSRYNFDVIYTDESFKLKKAFGGSVIITETL